MILEDINREIRRLFLGTGRRTQVSLEATRVKSEWAEQAEWKDGVVGESYEAQTLNVTIKLDRNFHSFGLPRYLPGATIHRFPLESVGGEKLTPQELHVLHQLCLLIRDRLHVSIELRKEGDNGEDA